MTLNSRLLTLLHVLVGILIIDKGLKSGVRLRKIGDTNSVGKGADWWLPSHTCYFLLVSTNLKHLELYLLGVDSLGNSMALYSSLADLMAFLRFCLFSLNASMFEPSASCSELSIYGLWYSKSWPVYHYLPVKEPWNGGLEFLMEEFYLVNKCCASWKRAWHLIRHSHHQWERINPNFLLHVSGYKVTEGCA